MTNNQIISVMVTLCLVTIGRLTFSQDGPIFKYPLLEKTNEKDTIFGQVIEDPFRFLEDNNDPRTKKFKESQTEFTEKQSRRIKNVEFIQNRLLVKTYADFRPLTKQGNYFFHYEKDIESASLLYYRLKYNGIDKFVASSFQFNLNRKDVASIEGFRLSPNSKYVALSISHSGSDWREIRIVDIIEKKTLSDQIKWVRFSDILWKNDGFFYCRYDESKSVKSTEKIQHQQLYYHKIGTSQADDRLVYDIPTASFSFFDFDVTSDESTLFVYSSVVANGKTLNVILAKDLNDSSANYFKPLITWRGNSDTFYSIIHKEGNKVYVVSNANGFNKSILELDLASPNKALVVVPMSDLRIVDVKVVNKKIVCVYSDLFNSAFAIYDLQGQLVKTWKIPQGADVKGMFADDSDTELIYCFESFYYPASFYTVDLNTFERKPLSKTGILYNVDNIITEFVQYPSKDGTFIPMFLTYKKKIKRNGQNPCLVVGYGGFGMSMSPTFNPIYQVLYDNNCIIAVPCIRGGGEKWGWHEQGKNLKKSNSFDDFIYAAEYLIKENYSNKSLIGAYGSSNGGLLVAAVMTKRPDLFKVIVSEAAVLDMIRYDKFTGGFLWQKEYGSRSNKDEFDNLLSYSPLHNVKKGVNYPATLFIAAENDDRVPPLHSYKMLATMQETVSPSNLYLLYQQTIAGHSGSEILSNELKKDAFMLSFIFYYWGMKSKLYQGY